MLQSRRWQIFNISAKSEGLLLSKNDFCKLFGYFFFKNWLGQIPTIPIYYARPFVVDIYGVAAGAANF